MTETRDQTEQLSSSFLNTGTSPGLENRNKIPGDPLCDSLVQVCRPKENPQTSYWFYILPSAEDYEREMMRIHIRTFQMSPPSCPQTCQEVHGCITHKSTVVIKLQLSTMIHVFIFCLILSLTRQLINFSVNFTNGDFSMGCIKHLHGKSHFPFLFLVNVNILSKTLEVTLVPAL